MATIIHNRGAEVIPETEDSWLGTLLVGVVLVILAILFFVYAIPALRTGSTAPTTDSTVPQQIDVNLNTPAPTTPGATAE